MPGIVSLAGVVELAVVERSGFIESRHAGIAIVLGPDGSEIARHGDASSLVLPRSSLKPLQALGSLTAGAELEGEQLGLATASHSGTDRHVAVVGDILDSAGLTEEDLGCPAAWPSDTAARDELVRVHAEPSRLRMNCSGKHAAMLLACRASGWPVDGYLDPRHPLQTHLREVVERMTGEKPAATAVDGCGAPVYAMSVAALARGIHRLGTASERSPFALHRSAAAIVRAVREHPWTIAGPGQHDTIVAERLGVFAKGGAEGVMVMVAPDGTTVALKMLDGSGRAASIVALQLLADAGALTAGQVADAASALPLAVHGGGRDVGVIRPVFGTRE
ncbi:asparaginase [Microbacterium sp.]|uniref:asparaginase n=1 Tax=Microbacterium sp. TaxID=51671 RepID=UPI0037CA62F1